MAEYIEREAVLEKAEYDGNYRLIVPADTVKSLPAADVAPVVHGRWRNTVDCDWECSRCGMDWYFYEENPIEMGVHYCPNCGARMDGGAENEP